MRLPISSTWPPGLYLVESVERGRPSGVAGLVVRDSGPARPAAVMYSYLTWNAYSGYGGASLYKGAGHRESTRALSASLLRPESGPGAIRLLVEDVPVAQQLDRLGIAADPLVDTDVDSWPSLVSHRTELVLPGHSEYWTRRMFDAFTAARNTGSNIADLGANDMYWQARVTYGADRVPTSMFVARSVTRDPLAATSPEQATVLWRDPPLWRDPAAVLGESATAVRARGSMQVMSVPAWLRGVRGLSKGAILSGVAVKETNGPAPGRPLPPNLQIIALGALRQTGVHDVPAGITYYSTRSGGGVFDTGTIYWPCLIAQDCRDAAVTRATAATMWQITARVLVDFLRPHWGASHPSIPSPVPGFSDLHLVLDPRAIGTYGNGD